MRHFRTQIIHKADPAGPTTVPDALVQLIEQGRSVAQCGLWWRNTPSIERNEATGMIGQCSAVDREAARSLLNTATATLADLGMKHILGPIDGDTWHAHRLAVWSDDSPPFPMEPLCSPEWVENWETAGFRPVLSYHSAMARPDGVSDPRLARLKQRLQARGVRLRPIDLERFEEDLRRIHALSQVSFSQNPLFRPLPLEEFLDIYRPFKQAFDPSASAIAEGPEGVVGFIFCYPAPAEDTSQPPGLVIKTLAIKPGRANAGLGVWLADHAYQVAYQAGYSTVIHALMQDSNGSAQIRSSKARIFRRYALFGKTL